MPAANGAATALNEITLVLFTTLAPSGVMGLILMGFPILFGFATAQQRQAIDRLMCIPLTTALVGLVASATHLGNPANALYVLAGVGRSPLSNEVFSGVVFLGLAGIYWLSSFAEKPRYRLRRLLLGLISLAGVAFVTAIAFAYDAETIVTWHSPLVPLGLWANALVGGPALAMLSLQAAGFPLAKTRFGRALMTVAATALVANLVAYGLQGFSLAATENHTTTASALVPAWNALVAGFGLLCATGLGVIYLALARPGRFPLPLFIAGNLLRAMGIFLMRFAFYMTHLTVGLGM